MGGRGSAGNRNKDIIGHTVTNNPVNQLMTDLNISKYRAKQMLSDLDRWSSFGFEDIRSGQDKELENSLEEFLFMSKNWNAGTLYRAISNEQAEKLNIGDVLPKQLTSYTSNENVALNRQSAGGAFGKQNAIMVIPNNVAINGASIKAYSSSSWEDEVLLSKSNTLMVDKIEKHNKRIYIYLRRKK